MTQPHIGSAEAYYKGDVGKGPFRLWRSTCTPMWSAIRSADPLVWSRPWGICLNLSINPSSSRSSIVGWMNSIPAKLA